MGPTRSTRVAPGFVGEDRRRAPTDTGFGTVVLTGVVLVVAATAAAQLAAEPSRPFDVGLVLDTVTAVAAVAVFALCRARWELVGKSAPLWAGTGALTFGVAAVALPNVVGPLLGGRSSVADSTLAEAGVWVAVIAFAVGALAPAVDTRVRPLRLAAGAAVVVAVFASAVAAVPGLGNDVPAILAAAGVGVLLAVRSSARGWQHGWCALLLLGVVAGLVASGIATPVAHAVSFSVAAVACALELVRDYVDQRTRLFDSEITLEATAMGERVVAAGQRERRHDVRNAVLAIEGSAVTLERYLERLSETDRASLTSALSSGVERLQRLLGDEAATEATVDLAALAATVSTADGGSRERVVVDVPDGLVATGSLPLSREVLRILMDNARRRAPGQPIVLEGRRDGDWMVLQVRDRAAPIPRDERRTFVDADMGFLVAARLMRNQAGDLWVESHPEGGAFSLCLPAVRTHEERADSGLGA